MKLSKILMTAAAAIAVLGFAGCASSDDDPNGMISGKNKSYSIDYTNTTDDVSRGYKDTAYAHAGAAVQLDFTELTADKTGAGVMGLIFDLVTTDKSTNTRSFDVIGVKTSDTAGGLTYYVSRFENVTDIQAQNFGAPENGYEGNGATEKVYVKAWTNMATGKNENNTTTVYAYAIQKKADAAGTDTFGTSYTDNEYVYKVYLLNDTIAKLDSNGNLINDAKQAVTLSESDCLATIATGYTKLTQAKLAVYANVYGGKTLTGNWTYRGDYHYCGVDED